MIFRVRLHPIRSCLILFFLVLCAVGFGQPVRTLTLEEAIDIALEKSYEMKSLRLSLLQAEENLTAARGRFRTNASLQLNVPDWRENLEEIRVKNQLPYFNTTGIIRYQGILDVNQPLPTDGTITLRSQMYHRTVSIFLDELDQDLKRREIYTSLSLRFHQPLFTINRLRLGLRTANLNYERTSRRFKRSELDIIYLVTQSFFNLYRATRQAEIARETVEQQQELYDLAKKKYEAGLIPEVEALQMEVDLAESQNSLVEAEGNLARAEDSFKQLIGLKLTDRVRVRTSIEFEDYKVPLDKAIEYALKYRSEIRENEINVELARINVREADARSEIRGDFLAFYDFSGISDPALPFSTSPRDLWNSSLDDLRGRPNNRGVVFSLTVPIWDWGVNAAEVAAAQAQLRDSELALQEEKKTITREVRNVVGRLKEARNRVEVLRKSQEVAKRTFEISVERFNNGDITSQELALDRNRYTQAKFSFLTAYIDYKLAEADLKRKTMWDFAANHSLLESVR